MQCFSCLIALQCTIVCTGAAATLCYLIEQAFLVSLDSSIVSWSVYGKQTACYSEIIQHINISRRRRYHCSLACRCQQSKRADEPSEAILFYRNQRKLCSADLT